MELKHEGYAEGNYKANGMKFPPEVQKLLIKAGRFEKWGIGRTIVREGHPAQCFYILLDGEMEVTIVDKAALEAATLGIRRTYLAKGVTTIADRAAEEKRCKESAMERAYVRHLAGILALVNVNYSYSIGGYIRRNCIQNKWNQNFNRPYNTNL
jgi:hypothetical protein